MTGLDKLAMENSVEGEDLTCVVGVSAWVVKPVRPVDQVNWLGTVLQQIIIGSLVHGTDLVATEGDGFDRPVAVLDVEDLGGERSNNAKVVAGTLHRPPKVRVGVDRRQGSVGKDNVHRDKLVSDQSMVSLEPAVTSTETRAENADTLAGSSH